MSWTFFIGKAILNRKGGGKNMNQQKVGLFLKKLRKEKSITQEQLADVLGVSNRSISRWENGTTMPDFDLLIQMAKYYDVEVGEILDGERKAENMDKITEETMIKVADYNNAEKMVFSRKLCYLFIAGLVAFCVYMVIDICGLAEEKIYEDIASAMLGLVFGDLLLGALYSSRYITKIRAAKMRLLNHGKAALDRWL